MDNITINETVFATVGTTSFDQLVEALLSDDVLTVKYWSSTENFFSTDSMVFQINSSKSNVSLKVLHAQGYRKLVLQVGRNKIEPIKENRCGVAISSYGLKPSIREDIESAGLIISHAGALTVKLAWNFGMIVGKNVVFPIFSQLTFLTNQTINRSVCAWRVAVQQINQSIDRSMNWHY